MVVFCFTQRMLIYCACVLSKSKNERILYWVLRIFHSPAPCLPKKWERKRQKNGHHFVYSLIYIQYGGALSVNLLLFSLHFHPLPPPANLKVIYCLILQEIVCTFVITRWLKEKLVEKCDDWMETRFFYFGSFLLTMAYPSWSLFFFSISLVAHRWSQANLKKFCEFSLKWPSSHSGFLGKLVKIFGKLNSLVLVSNNIYTCYTYTRSKVEW